MKTIPLSFENSKPQNLSVKGACVKFLKPVLKSYLKLSKAGIVFFALLSAGAGFGLAYLIKQSNPEVGLTASSYDSSLPFPFLWLMMGLYLATSGGFVLNQASEWKLDSLMNRTKTRPVPAGKLTALQAFSLGIMQIIVGLFILLALKPLTAGLTLLAVLLYNIFYTKLWKKKWVFSAVPGALPGALPVMIGWSLASSAVFSIECLYLFFVLFLWQMPHFWSLTLRYQEDYKKAGVPVPPIRLGRRKTLYYMAFYLLSYLGMALISPLFFKMNIVYIFLLIPFCVKVLWEFIKFSAPQAGFSLAKANLSPLATPKDSIETLNSKFHPVPTTTTPKDSVETLNSKFHPVPTTTTPKDSVENPNKAETKNSIETPENTKWKPFFLWLNFSVLVFLYAPVLDLWLYSLTR